MTKITYFDGDRELYTHNLSADKVMINGKIIWKKEELVDEPVFGFKKVYQNKLKQELNVGDIVKYREGHIGKVESFDKYDFASVRYLNNVLYYIHIEDLAKIDEPVFEIGDYVRVTNNRISDYQKSGKVIDIKSGVSLVEFSDYNKERISFSKNQNNGHFYWHENKDLEKVK